MFVGVCINAHRHLLFYGENKMKIYMIRHGQTDWNKKNLLQGRSDIRLNEEGRKMAEKAACELKDVDFFRIYSSPLMRAYETAEIIRGDRDIPVICDERIIEMSFGDYEGKYYNKNHMDPDDGIYNFFFKPECYTAKNGEVIKDIKERTADFLRDITSDDQLKNKNILVSAHGAAIAAMMSYVKNRKDEDFWKDGVAGNCAVIVLEADDTGIRVTE